MHLKPRARKSRGRSREKEPRESKKQEQRESEAADYLKHGKRHLFRSVGKPLKKIYREYSKADPEQLVRRNNTNHLNLPFGAWVVGTRYNPEQMSAQIRKAPYHVQVIYVAKPMDSCDDDFPCFVKLMSMAE